MSDTASVTTRGTGEWTPARWFMLVAAVWHIPLGIIGLIYDRTFPIGSGAASRAHSEHIFGIFETNGWHNLAAVVIAVPSLAVVYAWPRFTRVMSLVVGVSNTAVFVLFAVIDPATVWVASNAADQVIHALTGAGGILAAIVTRSTTTRQRQAATM